MTPKTSRTVMALLLTLAMLGAVSAAVAQGPDQQGQQGQRGRMREATFLERAWTAVCFQLECTQEQIMQLMPIFAAELQRREQAVAAAREAQNFEVMAAAYAECRSNLEAALGNVLSDQQWAAFQELVATWYRGRGQGPGGGPGGPPPAGGAPPPAPPAQ